MRIKPHPPSLNCVMKVSRGVFGKATAITLGALGGGGFGHYWRETHMVKKWKKQRSELEEQLKELKQNRHEKEQEQYVAKN